MHGVRGKASPQGCITRSLILHFCRRLFPMLELQSWTNNKIEIAIGSLFLPLHFVSSRPQQHIRCNSSRDINILHIIKTFTANFNNFSKVRQQNAQIKQHFLSPFEHPLPLESKCVLMITIIIICYSITISQSPYDGDYIYKEAAVPEKEGAKNQENKK